MESYWKIRRFPLKITSLIPSRCWTAAEYCNRSPAGMMTLLFLSAIREEKDKKIKIKIVPVAFIK